MGIKSSKFEHFLRDFGVETDWDVILIQEFTSAKNVDVFVNKTTHKVILRAPVVGSRACGIVINNRIAHCLIPNSEVFMGRATSACIHWEGWNLKLVASHLAADYTR